MKRLALLVAVAMLSACASDRVDVTRMSAEVIRPLRLSDVQDGRGRFREILCKLTEVRGEQFPDRRPCDRALVALVDEPARDTRPVNTGPARVPLRFIFVTGIFGECVSNLGAPFSDAYPHLTSLGYKAEPLIVPGRSSSELNAQVIDRWMSETLSSAGEAVVLVGYSKGTSDILVALNRYPQAAWRRHVVAVVSVAGTVNGSPLADKLAPFYDRVAARLPWPTCKPGDGGGVDSLARLERVRALEAPPPSDKIRYFSVVALPVNNGINPLLSSFRQELDKIDPRNDGQVLAYDAVFPKGTLLGYADADHWSVALPFNRSSHPAAQLLSGNNAYPREILIEAVARFIEERL